MVIMEWIANSIAVFALVDLGFWIREARFEDSELDTFFN